MEHTIKDFRNVPEIFFFDDKEEYTREEVKALLYSQIANIHNDINGIIRPFTIDALGQHRDWDEEEERIMNYLKNPRCIKF